MALQWILFDLDNTLLDFDGAADQALSDTLTELDLDGQKDLKFSYHQINHQCWSRFERGEIDIPTLKKQRFELFVSENHLNVDAELMNRKYLDRLSEQVIEIDGARNLLDQSRKHFKLVLVTNGFAEVQHPRIERSGFRSYFQHIVISEEIGANKPASAFFDHTFDLMAKPEKDEVMIIGDSLSSDIKGGYDYGIRTCWYNPKKQQNQTDIRPDYTIQALEELPNHW
ncbi:MAG: YjjG family noncanonical pyrimidine nucleotidase [Saprospiraceae bacterium]|nr:YjjG family noncanonical pyrimidine nucleotidase [Saprospiraceae bacterium]